MKLGLAFGGGGVAGCAHLGVLLALEEAKIPIHCLAGTSAGALVSALYAHGYSAKELVSEVPRLSKKYIDIDWWTLVTKLFGRKKSFMGFVKGDRLYEFLREKTGAATMNSIPLPVAILSLDLQTAKKVVFSSCAPGFTDMDTQWISDIPIADAVRSSISIPFVFNPVRYQEHLLVDGGVLENCPIFALKALGADITIAVDLVCADPVVEPFASCFSVLSRVVSIHLAYQTKERTKGADFIFRPAARKVGAFEFKRSMECVEYGYEYMRGRLDEIKAALEQ